MKTPENGNMFFIILIAIALVGLLSVAIRGSGEDANIDRENFSIKASQVLQYGVELEQAVKLILQDGASESDLRFAHADALSTYGDISTTPEYQIFSVSGGAAEYRTAPKGVNDGSNWEFYGTYQYPQVGSYRPDLVAILPNVDKGFCDVINNRVGLDIESTYPAQDGGGSCPYSGTSDQFVGTFSLNGTLDETTFSSMPAMHGCFSCDGDTTYHVFQVILAR